MALDHGSNFFWPAGGAEITDKVTASQLALKKEICQLGQSQEKLTVTEYNLGSQIGNING